MANLPLSHNPRLKDPPFLGALDHGVRLAFRNGPDRCAVKPAVDGHADTDKKHLDLDR